MAGSIETRLTDPGLTLPASAKLPPGVAISFEWVRARGKRAFVSGHGPLAPDGTPAGPFGKAFHRARNDAIVDNGCAGYSGSIADKSGFSEATLPPTITYVHLVRALRYRNDDLEHSDNIDRGVAAVGQPTTVLRAAIDTGRAVGLEIAIFNHALDTDGTIAGAFVDCLAQALSRTSGS